jgi:hypothetical protein
MLYKVSPFGYFSRVTKVSRGPWFEENNVEDDGLEYFYIFGNGGENLHLLSNNIPIEERMKLDRLYKGMTRNYHLAWFAGLWLGTETVLRVPYFKKMALGWRLMSLVGTAFVFKSAFQFYNGMTYGPVVSAFLRKNIENSHKDRFEIKDRKREYFEIDTTQYMSYDFQDLGHEHHAHHGPQPVSFNCLMAIIGRRDSGQHLASRIGQVPERRAQHSEAAQELHEL